MDSDQAGTPAIGRPRDDAATETLLRVTRDLVIQHGYRDVSIQMIAAAAGVGRQTLYRRWPGKADLVLEAFFASAAKRGDAKPGPVAESLSGYLRALFRNLERNGPAIRSLIASAQDDTEFLQSFKQKFVLPRAEVAAAVLRRAVGNGELPADADIEVALAALHGAFWYRLLLDEPLTQGFAERLAHNIVRGLRAG